jgi:alkylresorcinol/alkylpyrone synthase
MSGRPRITSVATALPEHRVTQAEAKIEARRAFADLRGIDRLIRVFDGAGVDARHLAFPKEYYLSPRPFGERNRHYIRSARKLGGRAVRDALRRSAIAPGEVGAFLFTTTTGLATPSLDALLAEELELPRDVRRIPLFGLGCAGGAGGIALAADYLRAHPEKVAVVLSVELCSLTLRLETITPVNLVGTALFGDGAGCAVLAGSRRPEAGTEVTATETFLFPDSSGFMGWDFSEAGFGLVLSPQVASFITEALPPRLEAFLAKHGLTLPDLQHLALHPGGRRVVEAYRQGLGLEEEALAPTRAVLRRYGNLSSASVLFSLAEVLETGSPQAGDLGLLAALGPGFAAEMVLLRF